MAKQFEYEWWVVEVDETTGRNTWEVKARNRENAVKEINRRVKKQNKAATDESLPWWERNGMVNEVDWETLKLDRIGHQR